MKILYVTTVGSTMGFFYEHFRMFIKEGHEIEIACGNAKPISEKIASLGLPSHTIAFSRSPFSKDNLKAYKQLRELIENGNYDIVHCHTPNASVITRLVCRKLRKKNGLKVFYTAHGFHFYKGATKLNWLLYYPIENFCSRFTDKLITINTEDYKLAKKKFKAKEVHLVPSVGVDFSRFEDVCVDRNEKRHEIGVPEYAKLLLSVGELNENKNHQVIVRAIAKLNDANIHYAIAGIGDKKEYLLNLAKELGVEAQVHLLGFRKDIAELNYSSDIFCLPSYREGLGIASIEAMSCGLPIVTSNVHGINDYSIDGVTGHTSAPGDVNGFAEAINKLISCPETAKEMGKANMGRVEKYDMSNVLKIMREIYELH
ncbi:MAG: glycosyltransferase family 4 protein [Clostridia bacterium]|nr:glycosyltransferase family 4 protein [Clostridia bacterium]